MITVAGRPARFASWVRNPVANEIVVRVEMPAGVARLELFDLQDRKLRERRVSESGAVSMGGTRGLGPGVYLLRLAQGARACTSRVCIVP